MCSKAYDRARISPFSSSISWLLWLTHVNMSSNKSHNFNRKKNLSKTVTSIYGENTSSKKYLWSKYQLNCARFFFLRTLLLIFHIASFYFFKMQSRLYWTKSSWTILCHKEKFILPLNKGKINFKVVMTLFNEKQKYDDNNELCGTLLWFSLLPWFE